MANDDANPVVPLNPRQLRKLIRERHSYRHHDAAALLHWTVTDREHGVHCAVAMHRINDYLVGARNQIRRIKRSIGRIDRSRSHVMAFRTSRTSWQTALQQVFFDIHYYFVCWDTIRKMVQFLKARSGFKAAGDVFKHHRRVLEHYGDARDHLEHYDERLLGRKKKERLAIPSDMGNLHGYVWTLGGERYDVGPASLKQLERIVSELEEKVVQEAIPRYQKILEADRKSSVLAQTRVC